MWWLQYTHTHTHTHTHMHAHTLRASRYSVQPKRMWRSSLKIIKQDESAWYAYFHLGSALYIPLPPPLPQEVLRMQANLCLCPMLQFCPPLNHNFSKWPDYPLPSSPYIGCRPVSPGEIWALAFGKGPEEEHSWSQPPLGAVGGASADPERYIGAGQGGWGGGFATVF